ncbi:hypothetical protein BN1723_002338 [Verticillium longisporum]|uniref:Uncharacterized protein n=1 Tax=Verticillium longisporum TaxID=100787 RepID=A0A0G4L5Y8_VERLO|nr:hypothetical protein BN1723_002338 [Verticillium longisporum]
MAKAKTPASPGVAGKVKKKGQGQAIQTAASMSTSTSSSASTAAMALPVVSGLVPASVTPCSGKTSERFGHQHPHICGITRLNAVMLTFLHFPHAAAAAAAARGATSQAWTGRALKRTWVSPSTVSNTRSASASLPTRDSIGPVDEKILADQLHIVSQGW